MASRFFLDVPLHSDTVITVSDSVAHYLRTVLRLTAGTDITVFNGQGGEFRATIEAIRKHAVEIRVGSFNPDNRSAPADVHLGLCVIKREAMETALQLATELGVRRITPLVSEHLAVSLKTLRNRDQLWQQVIRGSCEQSGLNLPPVLEPMTDFSDFLKQTDGPNRFIAHPDQGLNLITTPLSDAPVYLLIGPEGGFSDAEVKAARQTGFRPVSLGPRILRAAHAPGVLLGIIQGRLGGLNQT
ncbi:MAG: 16S rRNA (uracil(1498)-N(3))-methyltransferase [Pseudomonadales bacterium]|nr:16S rRNA (uracil(1498)-N(3))-methyltransferase [Pseudomonadales bacterium]